MSLAQFDDLKIKFHADEHPESKNPIDLTFDKTMF